MAGIAGTTSDKPVMMKNAMASNKCASLQKSTLRSNSAKIKKTAAGGGILSGQLWKTLQSIRSVQSAVYTNQINRLDPDLTAGRNVSLLLTGRGRQLAYLEPSKDA